MRLDKVTRKVLEAVYGKPQVHAPGLVPPPGNRKARRSWVVQQRKAMVEANRRRFEKRGVKRAR